MARVDLHCHTNASFDGHVDPVALVRRAAERGLTHIAITDHDTIDGAREAVARASAGIHVIVGSEVLTTEGDLIFVFLQQALPRGLSAREAIEAGREQGALVGIPHPFDRTRRSLLRDAANPEQVALVSLVDWIEVHNARVPWQRVNDQAADLARRTGVPGIGVSDAHALLEVGAACTVMAGDPGDPDGLLAGLRGPMTIEGGPRAAERSWRSRLHVPGRRVTGT